MKAPEFHSNSKDEIGRLFWGDVVEAADELAVTDVTGYTSRAMPKSTIFTFRLRRLRCWPV
jgi:hypothetical protein